MKRTHEARVELGQKAGHKHAHKPCRIDIGIHKTKRHEANEITEHRIDEEISGQLKVIDD